MIAALYVQTDGCYQGLPDVDPWDAKRDARLYAGPHPVVAHPPCARWCMWAGFVERKYPDRKRGEDGGTFAAALSAVEQWGGVLEHPRNTAPGQLTDCRDRHWAHGRAICGGRGGQPRSAKPPTGTAHRN